MLGERTLLHGPPVVVPHHAIIFRASDATRAFFVVQVAVETVGLLRLAECIPSRVLHTSKSLPAENGRRPLCCLWKGVWERNAEKQNDQDEYEQHEKIHHGRKRGERCKFASKREGQVMRNGGDSLLKLMWFSFCTWP